MPMTGLEEVERDHILRALEASNWVVGGRNGAAARLGMKTNLIGLQNAEAWYKSFVCYPKQESRRTRLFLTQSACCRECFDLLLDAGIGNRPRPLIGSSRLWHLVRFATVVQLQLEYHDGDNDCKYRV